MKKLICLAAMYAAFCASAACSQEMTPLQVKAEGIDKDGYIDPDFAFCVKAATGHVKPGHNKSVGLSWSKGPVSTRSYAIVAVDTDVPTVFDNAGKEGKTLPASMKRRDFYHWILFDIPVSKTAIPAYADSQAISKNGKSEINTPYGMRGVNDYAPYFATNPERRGVYAGYDGPCPPWNDERVHHYHFRVYALDVESLGLSGVIDGKTVMAAIQQHEVAKGEVIGKYTLNPDSKD